MSGWLLWTRWWTLGLHEDKEFSDHLSNQYLLKDYLLRAYVATPFALFSSLYFLGMTLDYFLQTGDLDERFPTSLHPKATFPATYKLRTTSLYAIAQCHKPLTVFIQ